MIYDDSLYGCVLLSEPVLLDLLNSTALRRLRNVLQHGITALIGITKPITRYEHSVGVMLLVQRFGGGVREQVAALLHDVSHTAFSHVIDHVFHDQGTQSYHERQKEWWLARTDVPDILAGHGFDWRDFLDDEQFPLLEQPLPRLCADRLDYFFRDASALQIITRDDVQAALSHLIVADGRLAVDDLAVATMLGNQFIATDSASWSNTDEVVIYELAARAIRLALERRILMEEDLWQTDALLWNRLRESSDSEVSHWVRLAEQRPYYVTDLETPTICVRTKVRTIDPDVLTVDGLRLVSDLNVEFRDHRDEYLRRKANGISVRLI